MARQTGVPTSSYLVSSGNSNQNAGEIVFDPTPALLDSGWGFRLVLPNGKPDMVTGFLNEDEAKAWLGSGLFANWLTMHGYTRDKVVLATLKEG